jgi:glycosyltransferase involved in cell wall biosynthesis
MYRVVIDARSVVARQSGIGNYVDALVRHMVPLATDMRFVILRHPDATAPIVRSERVEELHFRGETKSVDTVFRLGRAHSFAGCDLYHSPADLVPLGIRCPWVVTIHDLMWLEARKLASAFLPVRVANGIWYTLNIRRSVAGARRVIAISQATADAIQRVFPAAASKTTVVHHGLDHERYAPGNAGPRSVLDSIVPPGVRYSLIVGQGSPYKNHVGMVRAFVEAMRDRPDHKLVLVRRFSRIDRGMNQLMARPEVQGKVISVPFVPADILLALYRHARMLLFASHYEGFGLPALEAMSLGTPVLASTAAAVREVTGSGALHAIPDDHRDLVDKITRLDDDEELRQQLIDAGQRRAADFSWERAARATLDVYRAAIEG